MIKSLVAFFNPKESYRTLQTYGIVYGPTAAEVTVDQQIVHSGPLESGLLFKFITNVKVHGAVKVKIKLFYGKFTITHIRARYPALINNKYYGFVDFPQPISQPIIGHIIPLTVDKSLIYEHFMYNGPKQWLINSDSDEQVIVVDDYYCAAKNGIIRTDWQYYHKTIDIEELDNISLNR